MSKAALPALPSLTPAMKATPPTRSTGSPPPIRSTDGKDFGNAMKRAAAETPADKPTQKTDKPADASISDDDAPADDAAVKAETSPSQTGSALAGLIQALLAASPTPQRADAAVPGSTATAPAEPTPGTVSVPAALFAARAATSAEPTPAAASTFDLQTVTAALSAVAAKPTHEESPSTEVSASNVAALTTALGAAAIEMASKSADASVTVPAPTVIVRETATSAPVVSTPTAAMAQAGAPLTLDANDLPQRLGERLRWLVDGGIQEARLRLHPQELGSIDVRVRIESGSARVWFAADHPAARAALETALPQLRERFAGDGMMLDGSSVSSQSRGWDSQGQSPPPTPQRFESVLTGSDDDVVTTVSIPSSNAIVHDGVIDRYA